MNHAASYDSNYDTAAVAGGGARGHVSVAAQRGGARQGPQPNSPAHTSLPGWPAQPSPLPPACPSSTRMVALKQKGRELKEDFGIDKAEATSALKQSLGLGGGGIPVFSLFAMPGVDLTGHSSTAVSWTDDVAVATSSLNGSSTAVSGVDDGLAASSHVSLAVATSLDGCSSIVRQPLAAIATSHSGCRPHSPYLASSLSRCSPISHPM